MGELLDEEDEERVGVVSERRQGTSSSATKRTNRKVNIGYVRATFSTHLSCSRYICLVFHLYCRISHSLMVTPGESSSAFVFFGEELTCSLDGYAYTRSICYGLSTSSVDIFG